jgi:hypothetical protein
MSFVEGEVLLTYYNMCAGQTRGPPRRRAAQ